MNPSNRHSSPHKAEAHNAHESNEGQLPVHFEYHNPDATTVCVAGSFNDWHPHAKALHPRGNGAWTKDTTLAPGTYEYCLVVDGRFLPDPNAAETVPNPFGGHNSLLKVHAACGTPEATTTPTSPSKNNLKPKP